MWLISFNLNHGNLDFWIQFEFSPLWTHFGGGNLKIHFFFLWTTWCIIFSPIKSMDVTLRIQWKSQNFHFLVRCDDFQSISKRFFVPVEIVLIKICHEFCTHTYAIDFEFIFLSLISRYFVREMSVYRFHTKHHHHGFLCATQILFPSPS